MLLKGIADYDKIYLACGTTDLRKSVDGLCHIITGNFNLDPFANYLFLFCNKGRNRMKGLTWDRNGFCLYYKRLDGAGAKYIWPKTSNEARGIKAEQLALLLDGMAIEPPKGFGDMAARDF